MVNDTKTEERLIVATDYKPSDHGGIRGVEAKAIQSGAKRIVLGRPITGAKNPREAVLRTLEEIEVGLKSMV